MWVPLAGPVFRTVRVTYRRRHGQPGGGAGSSSPRGVPVSCPSQVGLPGGKNRRVAGLRRSEVASLAGVSVEYYTRLEQGALSGASWRSSTVSPRRCVSTTPSGHTCSTSLTPPARRHVHRGAEDPRDWKPHTSLQWLLDGITVGPAFVRNGRLDLVAAKSPRPRLLQGRLRHVGHPQLGAIHLP